MHSHLVPAAALARVPAAVDLKAGRQAPPELQSLDTHRSIQAQRKVDVSLIGPWIDMVKATDDAESQHAWCRVLNEELAAAVHGTTHSRFLAALPDADGGRAASALEQAVEAGAVGGMLAANPSHGTLARPDFDALWERAAGLKVPLVLHPGDFVPPPRLGDHFMVNLVGNPFETTLAVGTLLAAGVPERHADLRLVLVHGGGSFPYQYGRLDAGFARWPALAALRRPPPSEYLRWFHYDTVLFDDAPTRYLLDLVGDERVMAGSDCPFTMSDDRPFTAPDRLGLDPAATARVLGDNAQRLFNL